MTEPASIEDPPEEKVKELLSTAEPGPPAEPEPSAIAAAGSADGKQQSFWASFTASDMRTLVVTVAGTLVANILTVMAVALAVGVLRSPNESQTFPPIAWVLLGPVAVAACWGIVKVFRASSSFVRTNGLRSREDVKRYFTAAGRPMKSSVRVFVAVVLASYAALFLLVLLGEAAGVK